MNDSDEASKLPLSDVQLSAISLWSSLTSIESLRSCGENGDESWNERFTLAYLMELGCVDPVSDQQMFHLYEAAAKGGVPEAMLAAGHYLEHGIGVARKSTAACDWYFKAGKAGLDGGNIAHWMLAGPNVDATSAAKAGYIPAMIHLAECKLVDCWITSSYMPWEHWWALFEDGIEWLDCASESGSLKATLRLAEVLEGNSGHHFPEDIREQFLGYGGLERALECYRRAEGLGWKFAAQNIERIQKQLDAHDAEPDRDDG
jgi:TPR repeat protein